MGTYVVGDIHGCFDEWIYLKRKIEKRDKEAVFILVGDIVDRGPKVCDMLIWAMDHITEDGKYQMVIGNHELEKKEWIEEYFTAKMYYDQEMKEEFDLTMMRNDQYDFKQMCLLNEVTDEELYQIYLFLDSLPYYKQLEQNVEGKKRRFIIVHGGLPESCMNQDGSFKKRAIADYANNPAMQEMSEKRRHDIVWYRTNTGTSDANTYVIHGHTPTISEYCTLEGAHAGRIWTNPGNINVDCGITFRQARPLLNGKTKVVQPGDLAAIRLEDLKEFYVYGDC